LCASGQVFYQCDPAGTKMTFWGDVAHLFGHGKTGLQGDRCRWLQQIHPADLLHLAEIEADATEGKSHCREYRFCREDGSVIYLRDTSCYRRDARTKRLFLTGFLQNISEQHHRMAQINRLQKMQVFGELAGGVAHDFNNLLTIFHGYTEILQAGTKPGDPHQEYLSEMAHAVERAKALTSQLLNFSSKKPGTLEALRLGAVVMDFYKMLRRIIGENIELVTDIPEKGGWVMADPRQLETVLVNLVVNACQAMPKRGRLSIVVAETVLAPGDRRVRAGWKPGPYVQMTVSDNGIGMNKAFLKRIFAQEPGCGLSICSGIVEQSGGKIAAESAPGKGSKFKVFLPRIAPPTSIGLGNASAVSSKNAAVSFGKGKKILIVEDDIPVRKTLASLVRGFGCRVFCAANGDEALRILERERKIRLVITDMIMPLMGGIELVELIRYRWPGAKILLTSGYTFELPEIIDPKITSTVFLPKPLSRGVLAAKLRELLDA